MESIGLILFLCIACMRCITNEPIDPHAMPESDRCKCPKTLKLLYEFIHRKENSDIYF